MTTTTRSDAGLVESRMFPGIGASRRFESVEIGAVTVIVLASVVQGFFLYRLVPVLASLHANAGEALSLRLRVYIGLCNWALMLVPVVLLVWMGFQISGRPLPAAIGRRVLMAVAALAGPVTIAGIYFMAEDSLLQAMRLSTAVGASAQVLDRDLSVLYLASGDPDQVIALLDPKVSRDDFVTDVRWGAPGQAFQLGEAYRAKGDLPAALRFYLRAQQAAAGFDEVLTPRLVDRQVRWQAQFGRDFDFWFPNASEMKKLPDWIRAVSQQRLDQLPR
jgi:hypothetical protein